MKKKIEIGLIVALVVAIAGFAILSKPASAPAGIQPAHKAADAATAPEITLRNVTDRTITYKIYPVRRPEDLQTKEIAPNAIDRYRTNETMAIEFNTGAKDTIYSLDPGKPYSFRSDLGSG
ncbi:MAG: hypothetical protein ACXVI6_09055, partial [Candidatus Aminicenantales bacterium]